VNLDSISNGAKTILIIVMLIGGMAYSTAGGIKFDRLVLAIKSLSKWMNQINSTRTKRFFSQPTSSPSHTPSFLLRINNTNLINNNAHSNKESQAIRNKFYINDDIKKDSTPLNMTSILTTVSNNKIMRDTVLVIILFPLVSLGTAIAISYLNGSNLFDTFFESVSAVTNTGLTSGITTMDLDEYSKILLSVNMIIGRFEIISILYIFLGQLRSRH
ncbi:MAG: potassium transporter TrkG, partial [Nitrososphaeraceae archaeon]